MKQLASLVAGIFLVFIAVAQFVRFVFGTIVVAGGVTIPVWMSLMAAIFLGVLAFLLLRERKG